MRHGWPDVAVKTSRQPILITQHHRVLRRIMPDASAKSTLNHRDARRVT
jgi:hypothetical protein